MPRSSLGVRYGATSPANAVKKQRTDTPAQAGSGASASRTAAYAFGLRPGDRVRFLRDLVMRDHRNRPTETCTPRARSGPSYPTPVLPDRTCGSGRPMASSTRGTTINRYSTGSSVFQNQITPRDRHDRRSWGSPASVGIRTKGGDVQGSGHWTTLLAGCLKPQPTQVDARLMLACGAGSGLVRTGEPYAAARQTWHAALAELHRPA
jgi:hypothetical protein